MYIKKEIRNNMRIFTKEVLKKDARENDVFIIFNVARSSFTHISEYKVVFYILLLICTYIF
jgi:hypothetical protein